jgi:hypothetical protein
MDENDSHYTPFRSHYSHWIRQIKFIRLHAKGDGGIECMHQKRMPSPRMLKLYV